MTELVGAGTAIEKSGGGIVGAIAVILVGLGLLVAWFVWKAYDKKLSQEKAEDVKRIADLEDQVETLRCDGRHREETLIQLVMKQQSIQERNQTIMNDTNTILKEIKNEQLEQGRKLAFLHGMIEKGRQAGGEI